MDRKVNAWNGPYQRRGFPMPSNEAITAAMETFESRCLERNGFLRARRKSGTVKWGISGRARPPRSDQSFAYAN